MNYWAYLSYAHDDEAWARRVHRKIESFRVPRALRGQTVAGQVVGARLRPLFRDRDELASSGNLRESLERALEQSGALIVLCSPSAARSKWVEQEVRAFVERNGKHRVFPLIVSGEPNSGDEHECFPPSLRGEGEGGLEPIAGDLRKFADGPRDGILKVIAGLLEVGFDAIKRREAQRRHRSAMAFALVASVVAVVTSLTALYAVQQREIAELRRAQAEDLISFMLGDLRGRLREVGRLDVLDAVGEKAEEYFAALPPSEIDDTALEKQAMALRQIGEVRLQQGQHAEAQSAFAASLDQLEALSERHPDDSEVLFERAQAEFWLGMSHYRALEFDRALPLFERYAVSAGELVAMDGDNPDYKLEEAYARSNLGALAIDRGDLSAAERAFRESGAIFAGLAAADPDDPDLLFEVAANDSWLAAVLERRFDWRGAVGYRREAAEIHARVTASTGHPFHKRLEAGALSRQSRAELALGQTAAALATQRASIALHAELSEQDPENPEWRVLWLSARARQALLDTLANPADSAADRPAFDETLALAQGDPDNALWSGIAVSAGLDTVVQLMLDADEPGAAEVLAQIEPLVRANFAAAPEDLVSARHYYEAAVLAQLLGTGRVDDAYVRLLSQRGHRQANLHLAALMAELAGDPDAARALDEQLRVAGYASAKYLALQAMVRRS